MARRCLQGAVFAFAVAALLAPAHASSVNTVTRPVPVPSLDPSATQRLWRQLVRTSHAEPRARTFAAVPGCRPLRAVFYAETDWLRLATKLAANASPCAEYYISIPPLAAAKTKFRTDQAWRIRALGSNFHALAEAHMPGWRAWVTSTGSTWYQAGVEARRRMAAAGFSVQLGDGWVVNEFSSAVRRGLGTARADAREFVHGLYDGDGGPAIKGGVFDIGFGQTATNVSVYKAQLQDWLQDDAFWSDMNRYVTDWSQELYGDPRNYGVAGTARTTRRDYLNDYLRHQLVLAKAGGAASATASAFLGHADSPLANAAWQWDTGFGWTMLPSAQMEDYVSAQVYALRSFSALNGEPQDHWGLAWAPHNPTGLTNADFVSQTGAIADRLAAAIRDSARSLDAADPGVGACEPLGQNVWCTTDVAGAWLNDSWKNLGYWGQLALAFTTPSPSLTAGIASGPLTLQLRLADAGHETPSSLAVGLSSSSPRGLFASSPAGPWNSTLALTVPAGSDTSPAFYYSDTAAGSAVLSASATGTISGSETASVAPGPVAVVTVSPSRASVATRKSQLFTATGADAYGNATSAEGAQWSVTPAALGSVSPSSGASTTFVAGPGAGKGKVIATVGGSSGSAALEVSKPALAGCVVPSLRGTTLLAAARALKRGHCALGTVQRAFSRLIRRGRVISQTPAPGTHRRRGGRVDVVLSRGHRR